MTVETKQNAIITRSVDFWLIGGASLFAWATLMIFSHFRSAWSVRAHLEGLAVLSGTLSLFINYPHFMASYKIAYGRGWSFIRRHSFQLIVIPVILLALSVWGYLTFDAANLLPPSLNPLQISQGRAVMLSMVQFMFLIVGWHYIKQTFGCMMVYAKLDNYRLSKRQRRLLLSTLYVVWFGNFINANVGPVAISNYYGLPLPSVGLPMFVGLAIQIAFWLALGGLLFAVFVHNKRATGRWPSLNFMTPLVAQIVWWIPLFYQFEFYNYLVPMFHSLQYIPFAWRYETNRRASRQGRLQWSGSLIIVLLILAGYLSFEVLPGLGDAYLPPKNVLEAMPFVILATVFINIHHYFIDSVIWRFQQDEVQRFLFSEKPKALVDYPMPELIGEQALQEA